MMVAKKLGLFLKVGAWGAGGGWLFICKGGALAPVEFAPPRQNFCHGGFDGKDYRLTALHRKIFLLRFPQTEPKGLVFSGGGKRRGANEKTWAQKRGGKRGGAFKKIAPALEAPKKKKKKKPRFGPIFPIFAALFGGGNPLSIG